MFTYCGNSPISKVDYWGNAHADTDEEYRLVGGGIQLEIDVGCTSFGMEIIVFWDVQGCSDSEYIMATYTYVGGSIDFGDSLLGSIYGTVKENVDLLTCGTTEGISALLQILQNKYSASVSGLLIWGNDEFTSVESYEGPFFGYYGSVGHAKGSVAFSSNSIALAIGATTSSGPRVGLSLTTYTLRGVHKVEAPAKGYAPVSI